MHFLSITPGLKTLCYYGNGHFLSIKDSSASTICIELQTGGTVRLRGKNREKESAG